MNTVKHALSKGHQCPKQNACLLSKTHLKGGDTVGFWKKILGRKSETITKYQIVQERGNGAFIYNGKAYQSDIVQACLNPYIKAVGKLCPKHIRRTADTVQINPEPYMRFLLEEPNTILTMQKLLEKIMPSLILSGNAFILIVRDINGYPMELFPVPAVSAEAIYSNSELNVRFAYQNGKTYTHRYDDLIHLRMHISDNDVFGNEIVSVLSPLIETVSTIDTGLKKAIKNSAVIRWLLKYTQSLREEDIKTRADNFAKNYLEVSNQSVGVAATDAKADVVQITPKDYVPNFPIMESVRQRIYSLLGVNEKIVNGTYNEDEWNAWYEAAVEPIAIDLQSEFTRKLFSRRERGCGNYIVFESSNLACSSISTRLNFVQLVDRGSMLPDEWRALFNLGPIDGGNKPIRRLDTATVEGGDN